MAENSQPKATLTIEVDSTAGRAALKTFEKALEDSAKKQIVSLKGLGSAFAAATEAAFAGATAAVAGLTAATIHFAKAGADVEANERRAFAIMERRAKMTDAAKTALLNFNAALQSQLGKDADAILSAQATMSAMGVAQRDTEKATKAMLGLAAVFKLDIDQAAKIAGRVFSGELPKSLQKLGIHAKDAADAQRQLVEMFKVAAAEGDTFSARVSAAEEAWNDLDETIGLSVVGSGSLKGSIDVVREAFEGLTEFFGSAEGKQAVSDFFSVIVKGASDALNAVLGLFKAANDVRAAMNKGVTEDADQPVIGPNTAMSKAGGKLGMLLLASGSTGRTIRDFLYGSLDESKKTPDNGGAIVNILQTAADQLAAASGRGVEETPDTEKAGFGRGGKKPPKTPKGPAGPNTIIIPGTGVAMPPEYWDEIKKKNAQGVADVFSDYRAKIAGEQQIAEHEAEMNVGEDMNQLLGTFQKLGQPIADGMSSIMTEAIVSVADGSKSVLEALGGMVGGIITMLGTMMIQLGTAALAASALSAIPIFAGLVGPPGVGVGVALAAIAVGAGLVAVGSAIGGAASSAGSKAPSSRGGAGAGGSNQGHGTPTKGQAFGGERIPGLGSYNPLASGGGDVTYQVNFNGPMGGSPRAIARSVRDALTAGR